MQMEKLRDYLAGLPPETRRVLIRGLESAKARGENPRQYDLIMSVAREAFADDRTSFPARRLPQHIFFQPLEPFLISETLPEKRRGLIQRSSLDSIWQWLERDLATGEFSEVLERFSLVCAQGDVEAMDRYGRRLRARFLAVVREYLAALDVSPEGHQRLAGHIGGQRALEDLVDMIDVFESERSLTAFSAPLPARLGADPKSVGLVAANYQVFIGIEPERAIFALALVLPRFSPPESFVRFVVAAAGTDRIKDIAASRYAPAIDLIFGTIARLIEQFSSAIRDRKRRQEVADIVRQFHQWVRAATADLEIPPSSVWDKQISELRARMSNRLSDVIAGAPGLVRRALRAERRGDHFLPADETALEEAQATVKLFRAAATAKDCLAINQLLLKTRKPLEQMTETLTNDLLGKLRECDDADRRALAGYVDGALLICEELFGREYVSVINRAREALLKN